MDRLKQANPDFTFTTDAIVGFPGETEADFLETLEIVRRVKFAKVHVFPYSVRARTRAALYPNRIPSEAISHRKNRLLRASEEEAFELRRQFVGRRMEVLLEEGEGDLLFGHTANFLRVKVAKEGRRANDLVVVELQKNSPDGLEGRIV